MRDEVKKALDVLEDEYWHDPYRQDRAAIQHALATLREELERGERPRGFHDVEEFYPEEPKEPTLSEWKARAEEAEATLARYAPLIEAAGRVKRRNIEKESRGEYIDETTGVGELVEAALKVKEAKP